MKLLRLAALSIPLCMLGWQPKALSQTTQVPSPVPSLRASPPRDGRHDFDFNIGVWHTHIRRILDPFSASSNAMELDGTVTVRKIWDGQAQLEEIEADGPKGHWEGSTLFIYNPESHQWSQYFLNSRAPTLGPPLVGSFKDGRGELFAQDSFNDKSILVRGAWFGITPDSHHYEESYSNDGGRTWSPAFIATLTREHADPVSEVTAGAEPMSSAPEGHEFDFDFGTWKTHSSRLLHPLTGSTSWVELDGVTVVRKVWNGRANLAEYKAEGTGGTVQLLALRWFKPATQEWNIGFATPGGGTLGTPAIGTFKNGRVDFYDYEPINGKSVLVRFSIWRTGPAAAQSEQAFSEDGGKTWEVNWITRYTRMKAE
jgi:hypothetical protein